MFEQFRVTEVTIEENDFDDYSERKLINIFEKNNNVTLQLKNKDVISITYASCNIYGIRFAEVISFIHKKYINGSYLDLVDDDVKYSIIESKPLNPLDVKAAIRLFVKYYHNYKAGKKTIIKDLTDEEKDKIVEVLNRPLYDVEEEIV